MAIRTCPECGGKCTDTRPDCPHCGYIFPKVEISHVEKATQDNLKTQIVGIKCPHCGSNDVVMIDEDNYKCNVCESNFMVDKGPDTVINGNVIINEAAKPIFVNEQEYSKGFIYKSNITKEKFLNNVFKFLRDYNDSPIDIFEAKIGEVKEEFVEVLLAKGCSDNSGTKYAFAPYCRNDVFGKVEFSKIETAINIDDSKDVKTLDKIELSKLHLDDKCLETAKLSIHDQIYPRALASLADTLSGNRFTHRINLMEIVYYKVPVYSVTVELRGVKNVIYSPAIGEISLYMRSITPFVLTDEEIGWKNDLIAKNKRSTAINIVCTVFSLVLFILGPILTISTGIIPFAPIFAILGIILFAVFAVRFNSIAKKNKQRLDQLDVSRSERKKQEYENKIKNI